MTYFEPDSPPALYLIKIENDPDTSGVPEMTPFAFPVKDFGKPSNEKIGSSKPLVLNLTL